jgi:hypothetical protein
MERYVTIVALAALAAASGVLAQEPTLAEVQQKLAGAWVVDFGGGAPPRSWVVSTVAQTAPKAFSFSGTFNLAGQREAPISGGEASQEADGLRVRFTTASQAAIAATLRPDSTFVGVSRFQGKDFPFTAERPGSVEAFLSREQGLQLVSGKTLQWRHFRSGDEIEWNFDASGSLFVQNLSRGGSGRDSRDSGTWTLNESRQLCVTLNLARSNFCGLLARQGDRLRFVAQDRRTVVMEAALK